VSVKSWELVPWLLLLEIFVVRDSCQRLSIELPLASDGLLKLSSSKSFAAELEKLLDRARSVMCGRPKEPLNMLLKDPLLDKGDKRGFCERRRDKSDEVDGGCDEMSWSTGMKPDSVGCDTLTELMVFNGGVRTKWVAKSCESRIWFDAAISAAPKYPTRALGGVFCERGA